MTEIEEKPITTMQDVIDWHERRCKWFQHEGHPWGAMAHQSRLIADVCKKAASEWSPIDTAPEDGTWVMLTGGEADQDHWYGSPSPPQVVGKWIECGYESGFYFADYDGDFRIKYVGPTHWMTLPEAPH